ncbi:Survivin-1 [Operophtera brumata]|uniref:Survivin-1 n=1 Tax=Operophtera brumata TaxID=104452 RepID=A0A0L7LQS1_OPEBR|nr:Survivin-1 [Operophtera brumata]
MLKIVCAVWARDSEPGAAYDLQATLLRLAQPLLQMLSARHSHHAHPLYESIAYHSASWIRTYGVGNIAPAADSGADARVAGLLADVVRGAAMQKVIVKLLDNPEALARFIDEGGLELAVDKLTSKHLSGPSHKQGLVSSLMNYLKLPPQLINMSTPAGKKSQPAIVETVNGLFNIAPLCTISCGNPTAQAADVLLEGGGTATSGRGACAARRVRAAAWSYHFFSADDASLALTLTLPYAVRLHEFVRAVGVEAGCGGTLAPLGAPQDTSGMTFIRLVIARPVVATTVQLRLYKPRDSSNMGLLQLRLLAAPAFSVAVIAPPTPT